MDRRTVAPAPSACSRASTIVLIALAFGEAAFKEGSLGGMLGRPTNAGCVAAIVEVDLKVLASLFKFLVPKNGRIYSSKLSC